MNVCKNIILLNQKSDNAQQQFIIKIHMEVFHLLDLK